MPHIIGAEFVGDRRARADEGHVSAKHVPELRHFIKAGLAHELADWRDSRILLDLEHGRRAGSLRGLSLNLAGNELADIFLVNPRIAIRPHGAELQDRERFPVLAHALLPKEHRSLGGQLDDQRNGRKERSENQQSRSAAQNVDGAL